MKINKTKNKGFTLIEILVVIGIIGILATVVLVAVNPNRQFKQARDSQRVANVNTILNALGQNMADHEGNLVCAGTKIELAADTVFNLNSNGDTNDFNIADCLIPDYISKLPYDPKNEDGHFIDNDDFDTGYTLTRDGNNRFVVAATGEIQPVISVVR